MKFWIYENVPQWTSYCKLIEAASIEEALELARNHWSEIDEPEEGPMFSDVVEGVEVTYEASPYRR